MRSKNTSRILAVMLSLAVTVPMTQTAYLTTFAQSAASSWSVTAETTGGRLPSHVQSAFEKAMESYYSMPLIPLAYYGTQVVAGSNYALICKQQSMENGAECVLKDVTVYEHLDGNAEIASVEDFNIEDYAKRIIPIHYRASLHPDQWKCLKIFHPVSFQMKLQNPSIRYSSILTG